MNTDLHVGVANSPLRKQANPPEVRHYFTANLIRSNAPSDHLSAVVGSARVVAGSQAFEMGIGGTLFQQLSHR